MKRFDIDTDILLAYGLFLITLIAGIVSVSFYHHKELYQELSKTKAEKEVLLNKLKAYEDAEKKH